MLYLILVSLPLLFGASASSGSDPSPLFTYSFSPVSEGLANLSLVIGFLLAGMVQMHVQTQIYRRLSKKHGGDGRPEYRLVPMMVRISKPIYDFELY
jgi:hypothetical protein